MSKYRPIAIHLPQFHPIPENDKWWGTGFTEWTNVTRAKPLFKSHYQPQLPADLGYYDLRLPEARLAQAELAAQYGIYGFCYYHYWFNGKKLLERPIEEILRSGKPDFPYMLCWANENWTRRWDGASNEVLLKQEYSEKDDVEHFKYLIPFFNDPRYIKINNKPVFVIYRPYLIDDPTLVASRWRKIAKDFNIELYLCHMVFGKRAGWENLLMGFDAAIDFEPFGIRRLHKNKSELMKVFHFFNKVFNYLKSKSIHRKIYSCIPYSSLYQNLQDLQTFNFKIFPGVTPGWDNTPRLKKNIVMLDGSTPEKFEKWLRVVKNGFEPYSEEENLIFINAWNEWAEGNHLEPCLRWGRSYLNAVKRVFLEL